MNEWAHRGGFEVLDGGSGGLNVLAVTALSPLSLVKAHILKA